MVKWNDTRLEKLTGETVIDAGLRGQGSLVLRVTGDVRALYYRYFVDGQRRFELVGYHDKNGVKDWDEKAKGGMLTLTAAKEGFQALVRLQKRVGDLKAHYAALEAERIAKQRQAQAEARSGTFDDLLTDYVGSLKNATTATEVRGIFERNIRKPFPHLLSRRPDEVTPEDVVEIMRKMLARGVKRQANSLRSYLRAAYARAAKSVHNPLVPASKVFRITSNPCDPVAVVTDVDDNGVDAFARMGTRTLEAGELRAYLGKVNAIGNPVIKAFLLFHLYTGGQRVRQILRERWASYDLEENLLMLRDTKGRGAAMREHVVPLVPRALQALELVRPLNMPWPFAHDKDAPLAPTTASHAVQEICEAMISEGTASASFGLRDVRRTVETVLASLGVPREHRAHLLSHARPGKITQTYDRHHYLPEKLAAIEAWAKYLDGTAADQSKVVPLKKRVLPRAAAQ